MDFGDLACDLDWAKSIITLRVQCSVLCATLTKYCVLATGDSKVALAVDTTTYSVRLLGKDCAFFLDDGYHLSFIISNFTKTLFLWLEQKETASQYC